MGKTFKDTKGEIHPIEMAERRYSLEEDTDVVTGKISGYYVWIEENKIEVEQETYEALKEIIE